MHAFVCEEDPIALNNPRNYLNLIWKLQNTNRSQDYIILWNTVEVQINQFC